MRGNNKNWDNRKTVGAVERERERESGILSKTEKNYTLKLIIPIIISIIILSLAFYGFFSFKKTQNNEIAYNAEQLRSLEYKELSEEEQYADTNKNIKFAPFFAADYEGDNYSKRLLGACNEIGRTDNMYIEIGVDGDGTFQNGVITVNSQNFKYIMKMPSSSILKNNCISNNIKTIELNNIESGNSQLLMGDIESVIRGVEDYSRENEITLKGTWVPDNKDEEPQEIEKTIKVTVDWYGSAKADLYTPYTRINLTDFQKSENKIIEFDFTLEETKEQLLPKGNVIDIDIPELFGQYPQTVECVNYGVTETYNETEHKLHIERSSSAYSNKYTVRLTYPEEAYDQLYNGYTLSLPVKGYCESYANKNVKIDGVLTDDEEDSTGIYKTETVSGTKGISFYTVSSVTADYLFSAQIANKSYITVPSKTYSISKQNLMDAYDDSKEIGTMDYTVMWSVTKTTRETESKLGITMKETDKNSIYGDTWDGYQMSDYIRNTKIYFNESNFITQNGYVRVYDNDTNTLIKEFSYSDVKKYNSANSSYTYDASIKHIRVETNQVNPTSGASLYVYSIKQVDINGIKEKYKKEDMAKVQTLKTNLNGILSNGSSVTGADECYMVMEKSYASVNVSKRQLSALETDPIEQKILIQVPKRNVSYANWKNGEFLVAIESSRATEAESPISYIKLNNVSTTNPNVKITGYELIKKDGKYCIKIVTDNEEPTSDFSIDIDCEILVNPTVRSSTIDVKLYSYNQNLDLYYYSSQDKYDVNDNENTNDIVGLSTTTISVTALNSFMTIETVSNYNKNNETTIAPNIAEVEKNNKNNGKNTAQINVSLINNYDRGEVNNVVVMGKIPFEGNTYVDRKENLGSKFTTTIESGIKLPETMSQELKSATKIYYSTNDNPTSDVTDQNNKWIESSQIKDFKDVKTYLILIDSSRSLQTGRTYTFSYTVSIPDNAQINDISYGCHKVEYDYISGKDKLKMSAEPRKVGLRAVKYYDFDISKLKANTVHPVQGAKFKLTELNDKSDEEQADGEEQIEISKLITSNSEGKILLSNLRVNQMYSLQEIQAPQAYELNDKIIRFKVVEKEDEVNGNKLEIKFLSENNEELDEKSVQNSDINKFDKDVTIENDSDGKTVLKTSIEDTPKFALNIIKKDESSEEAIEGIIFKISEEGNEDGKTVKTDENGKGTIENLSLDKVYILSETYSKGRYQIKDVKFKLKKEVTEDGGANYSVEQLSNENGENCVFDSNVSNNDENLDLIQLNVNILNEKIPTFNLKIKKVNEENTEELLSGATFTLKSADLLNEMFYTTNGDGVINIPNQYAHVDGKYITGQYMLKETVAPNGYLNNREGIGFIVSKIEDENVVSGDDTSSGVEEEADNEELEKGEADKEESDKDESEKEKEKPQFEVKLIKKKSNDVQNEEQATEGQAEGDSLGKTAETEETEEASINDFQTIENIEVEGDTVIITIKDKPLFKLTKIDKETEEPLKNAEFIIYELNDDGTVGDQAKDVNGNYIGTLNEDGNYVVKTDEQGQIILPLYSGDYKAVEIGYPDGYKETPHSEVFTIKGDEDSYVSQINPPENDVVVPEYVDNTTKVLEIKSIEDLIDFAYEVNNGEKYEDTTVKLMKTLDFTDRECYEHPDENYKFKEENQDINEDGTTESIYNELTQTGTGKKGFPVIGQRDKTAVNRVFSGIFDGQNYEIRNLYINGEGGYTGLFGTVNNALIKNITITGNISSASSNVGGFCGQASGSSYFENCHNKCTITGKYWISGIVGNASGAVVSLVSCDNSGNITETSEWGDGVGGLIAETRNNIVNIQHCNNTGMVTGKYDNTGGIVGNVSNVKTLIMTDVSNSGTITGEAHENTGGIVGEAYNLSNGFISYVSNTGKVIGKGYTGGLFGNLNIKGDVVIDNCKNEGNLLSNDNMSGGIIGRSYGQASVYVIESYNSGDITTKKNEKYSSNRFGGLIGSSITVNVNIKSSYNTGRIEAYESETSTESVGGGLIGSAERNNLIMENSYNNGDLVNCSNIGGIVGYVENCNIYQCYNYGSIVHDSKKTSIGGKIGGLVYSVKSGTIKNSNNYGDINSNANTVGGIISGINGKNNIEKCSNFGNVTNKFVGDKYLTDNGIGGIIGECYGNGSNGSIVTNCTNLGNISEQNFNESSEYSVVGGIVGFCNNSNISVTNCNNSADIYVNRVRSNVGGLIGLGNNSTVSSSYNTGNINCIPENQSSYSGNMYIGGVSGSNSIIDSCYNEANISYKKNVSGIDSVYVGGIVGNTSKDVTNSYNTGNIIGIRGNEIETSMVTDTGGIAGKASLVKNCYNTGNIYDHVSEHNTSKYDKPGYYSAYENTVGPIYGIATQGESNYYPDNIEIVGVTEDVNKAYCTKTTEENMKTNEFCDALKEDCDKWIYIENEFPTLDIAVVNSTSEVTELTIVNEKKTFEITTEVGEDSSGNRDGGEISGENNDKYPKENEIKYVETVKYGETNKNKISIEPKDGYMIQKITINDREIPFKVDNKGNFELQPAYFDSITNKVHVIAYFINKENSLKINKTDEAENKLAGAKFRIESEAISEGNILGNLNKNGLYYFEKNNSGYIVPDNISVVGTVASSYYKLDLTTETQPVQVVIHAYNNYQNGTLYATITEDTNVPASSSDKNFLQTNETNSSSFVSEILQPGKVYYLHLGFDCTGTSSNKEVYIESIKVLSINDDEDEVVLKPQGCDGEELEEADNSYTLKNIQTESKFICIPIDLQGKKGNYEVELDVTSNNVSVWGMVTQEESSEPAEDNKQTCIYCSENVNDRCFATKALEGGKKYYLYISCTGVENSEGEVILKNIKLKKIYNSLIYETNENGQIVLEVPSGQYKITEIQAPKGYELSSDSKTVTIGGDGESEEKNSVDFQNQKQKEVIVHYYLKGTGEQNGTNPIKLKEDMHIYREKNKSEEDNKYDTTKYIEFELQGYTLEVDDNNQYIIPANATGQYEKEVEDVYYYYEKKENKLIDITATKQWDIPEEDANNYKATIRIVSIENGKEVPVINADGNEAVREIRGNGTVVFDNLKQYENGTKIEYKVKEEKIEKLESINSETQEENWVEIPLSQFKVTYGIEKE